MTQSAFLSGMDANVLLILCELDASDIGGWKRGSNSKHEMSPQSSLKTLGQQDL